MQISENNSEVDLESVSQTGENKVYEFNRSFSW